MPKKPDAVALLAALNRQAPVTEDDVPVPQPPRPAEDVIPAQAASDVAQLQAAPRAAKPAARSKPKAPRSELKHIGGYLDDETVEKVALLRIRLKLENSDLIKLAIEDLFRKHSAKRAFGEA